MGTCEFGDVLSVSINVWNLTTNWEPAEHLIAPQKSYDTVSIAAYRLL
jgi:hypothetical protein